MPWVSISLRSRIRSFSGVHLIGILERIDRSFRRRDKGACRPSEVYQEDCSWVFSSRKKEELGKSRELEEKEEYLE